MKKWISLFCLFILVIAAAFYFYIPSTQIQAYQTTASCTEAAVSRKMINKSNWQFWWPGKKINDTVYSYQNYIYRFDKILLNAIETTVYNNEDTLHGYLQFLYHGDDSTQFRFTSNFTYSANPIKRFTQYFHVKKISGNTENLLEAIKKYFDEPENIYGFNVVLQKITESSMIAVKNTFKNYPSTPEIYGMVQTVKEFIKENDGEENGFPMLHVHEDGPGVFETMVAIPTKTALPTKDQFQLKKMAEGYMLYAEVKGGLYTVLNGETELTNYVNDHKKNSPAIPFQSLVTNRLQESDTAKWITRLYYPVFN